jgi:hypothetical protein
MYKSLDWFSGAYDGKQWHDLGPFETKQEALEAAQAIAPNGGYYVFERIKLD